MIKFDISETSVVVTCEACGPDWAAFQWTLDAAETSGLGHEERVHPGITELRDRLQTRERVRRHRARAAV